MRQGERSSARSLQECYRLLNLKPGASAEEIKQSYRDLVRVWHPDRFAGDPHLTRITEQRLIEINAAYASLMRIKSSTAYGISEDKVRQPYSTAAAAEPKYSANFKRFFRGLLRKLAASSAPVYRFSAAGIWASAFLHATPGFAAVFVVLLVFYVAHEHVSGPFTQVAQILSEPGFPNPADTIPWPRGSDFAGVFTRNINFHLPQSKDSEGVPMYKLTEKTGPTYQAPRARRGPKSTRLFQGEALRTGAQLGLNVLSDGIGSITLHNRTNTDGVVEVARASAPHLYLSIVYLQANGTLAISGFGTGIYAITASFGHQWIRGRGSSCSKDHPLQRWDRFNSFNLNQLPGNTAILTKYS